LGPNISVDVIKNMESELDATTKKTSTTIDDILKKKEKELMKM